MLMLCILIWLLENIQSFKVIKTSIRINLCLYNRPNAPHGSSNAQSFCNHFGSN